jgi:5-methylcytosine-specific restriction endonuclease McrA
MRGEVFTGPIPKPQSRAAQKKASDRTKEREWQKVRQAVLVRDHYRCRSCGTPEKVDVHHIRFRSRGGEGSMENCASLCRVCHAEIHAYRLYAEGETRHSEPNANKRLRFVRV